MMSNEEKLHAFEQLVMKRAEEIRDGINRELDEKTEKELVSYRKQYRHEAARMRSKGLSETRKEARWIVSNAQNKGQNDLMAKRNEIIDRVFDRLTEQLAAFTRTEAYDGYFRKRLIDAVQAAAVYMGESNERVRILVTKQDLETKTELIRDIFEAIAVWAQAEVAVCEEDIIGGCLVTIPSLGLAIDNSMRADVARERESFLSWSGLTLQ